MATLHPLQQFWTSAKLKLTPTQLERYVAAGAPDYIQKFIAMGGGTKMGTTCEKLARFLFGPALKQRARGAGQTGYDHLLSLPGRKSPLYVEQKSSGHWGESDFKWQHVEPAHKWQMLLLCGIGYHDVRFWVMSRATYNELCEKGKITNQGNAAGESTEGTWFNYSTVREHLVPVTTVEELLAAAAVACPPS